MSGYTRTPLEVAQDDIRNLTNQVSYMQQTNNQLQNELKSQRNNSSGIISGLRNLIEERYRKYNNDISSMRTNLKNQENRHNQAIKQQQDLFYREQQNLKSQTEAQMRTERRQRELAILEESAKRQKELNRQKKDLERQIKNETKERKKALEAERKRVDNLIQQERNRVNGALKKERQLTEKQIKDLENKTNNKINELEIKTKERMSVMRKEITQETNNKLKDLEERAKKRMDNMQSEIDQLQHSIKIQKEYANDLVHDVQVSIDAIKNNLPHEKFAPNKLSIIESKLSVAKNNVTTNPQTAIGQAQEEYFQIAQLKEEIQQKETEFNNLHKEATETLKALLKIIQENQEIELDTEEEGVVEKKNVGGADYWTKGKYKDYQSKIETLNKELEDKEKPTTERLKQINEELDCLQNEHEDLVQQALENIASSQARVKIADSVAKTMEKQLFQVVDEGYEKEDYLNAYMMRMKNVAGTEVVAIINPETTTANSLVLNSSDASIHNPDVALKRTEDFIEDLKTEGVEAKSSPKCVDEQKLQDIYGNDFKSTMDNGIPDDLREKLNLKNPQK